MPEKSYTRSLGEGVRKRHFHKTVIGTVIDFVVQLEVEIEGEWKPVIRYDCSHDYTHIDRYNLKGEKEKIELNLDYAEALTIADEDININWESYKERFLKGGFP